MVNFTWQVRPGLFFISPDADGFLAQALLVGNFEAAVDICINTDRMVGGVCMRSIGVSVLLWCLVGVAV